MSEEGKQPESVEQSSGLNINAGGDVTTGDHVARDKVTNIYQVVSPPPTPLITDEPPAPGTSPFKGLEYFNEADADLFFGREALTAKLVGHLRHASRRFLAVVGASGSGKSSLVRAGLVPALKRGEPLADGALPPEGSAHWPIHVITPTSHPLKALAASLTHDSESVTATSTLMDDLANESRSLDLTVQRLLSRQSGVHLLIVVDQFEELFTLCRDETERQAFIDNLLTAVAPETDGPTIVVLTLRADFYAHCAQYADLRAALEKWQAYIGPMSSEELRQAIEEPATRNGWEFEPGLVDLLLRDVGAGTEPGALPLLSHALLETWKRRSGRRLTLKGYHESGGVRGAIAKTAETVYQQLAPEQQVIARNIFLRLTELGEGTQDTRRRAALTELIPHSEGKASVEVVLKTLADARLITTDEETADVAHEALIREWPTLRRWLDEDREGLQIHRRLAEATREWNDQNHDESELYRGGRLSSTLEWTEDHIDDLNTLEHEFLDASRALRISELEAAKKQAAQLRRRALYLAVALAIAIVTTIGAFFSGEQANSTANSNATLAAQNAVIANTAQAASTKAVAEANSRATAETDAQQQARIARSRQLAAQAVLHLDEQLDLSLLLGIEAYNVEHTAEAHGALLTGLQHSPRLRTFLRGPIAVSSMAFSPDGRVLAFAGGDRHDSTIILWDVAAHQPTGQPLIGHRDGVTSIAFSPDGKTLVSGSFDKTIILWDIVTRQPIGMFSGHTDFIRSVAFSPDGKMLASGSWDNTIILWDVATRQMIGQPLIGHRSDVESVAFSPDGKMLASGSWDNTIILWDVVTRQALGQPLIGHTNIVFSVAFSPDGKILASGSADNTIILWDVATRQALGQPLIGHTNPVKGVAFSPDGKILASGSSDKTIILWNVATHQHMDQPLTGHINGVTSVAFSPDGKILVSGSSDKTIILWNVATRQALGQPVIGHTDSVKSMAFSPDGKILASGSADNTVILWDVATHQALGQPLTGHKHSVFSVAFSPDGRTLASGGGDGTIILWDTATRQEVGQPLNGHPDLVFSVAFSPDGKTLASGSDDGTIILWDIATHQMLGPPLTNHTSAVSSVTFSPDGKTLAAGNWDNTVILWDMATRQPVGSPLIGHTSLVLSMAFSPDGKTLASGSLDTTIILWDVATHQPMGPPLPGHRFTVNSVVFSPDGKTLASGSLDSTVILWDVTTRQMIGQPLIGYMSDVESVAFSPDGKILASGISKTIILWDVDVESWKARACQIVARNLTQEEWKRYLDDEPYHKTCAEWPEESESGTPEAPRDTKDTNSALSCASRKRFQPFCD